MTRLRRFPEGVDSKWPTAQTSEDDIPEMPLNKFLVVLVSGVGTRVQACCEKELRGVNKWIAADAQINAIPHEMADNFMQAYFTVKNEFH
jgi:hypothetical protein